MKKTMNLVVVLVVFVMIFSLVGCKEKNTSGVNSNTSSTVSEEKPVSSEPVSSEVSSVVETSSETVSSKAEVSSKTATTVSSKKATGSGTTQKKTSVTSKAQASSTKTTSSAPVGNIGWICPDPAAHGSTVQDAAIWCTDPKTHQENIKEYESMLKRKAEYEAYVFPEGYDEYTWCMTHNRPKGDGHNGTCAIEWSDERGYYHATYD